MQHIEFTDDLLTGNKTLDEQHEKLIKIYNDFVEFIGSNGLATPEGYGESHRILNKLMLYTQNHFKYEEGFMRDIDYSEIDNHILLHADILEKLSDLCIEIFDDESLVFVIAHFFETWIINHIKKSDADFMLEYKNKVASS